MRTAEHGFYKRLDMFGAELDDRTDIVSKQIGLDIAGACGSGIVTGRRCGGDRKTPCLAPIALEIAFDPNMLVKVKCDSAASAVERERLDNVVVLRIKPNIRVIQPDFCFRGILSKRGGSEQQNYS